MKKEQERKKAAEAVERVAAAARNIPRRKDTKVLDTPQDGVLEDQSA